MSKNEMIVLVVMLATIFGGMAINDYVDTKASTEKAKAGLEQCPIDPNSISKETIWVKDCLAYTKLRQSE